MNIERGKRREGGFGFWVVFSGVVSVEDGGVEMSYALMTIIQRVLWLCSDKKGPVLLFDISRSKSVRPGLCFVFEIAD